ncbi:lipopolysaccharide assembly protein LapB [Halomonas sp. GXIMD04776]|uniref:lipopolysaccharide assembly protein LapB n=1 Tax=Halomonas sp. GXIMD04776 TaxID=3415605 RepID=UPI003CA54E2E
MPDLLLLALLVAAIAIGWWLGRRQREPLVRPVQQQSMLSRDYFTGLNYLLNEQPDRAIETFIQALEINSDTVDTHIALGNLFRSRGEADRAVRIHQNLLARPTLNTAQSDQVQLELSRDFLQLGVLDRAERLLQQLIRDTHDEDLRRSAKRLLVDLFEREREWQQALEVASSKLLRQEDDIRRAAAHWLCELAQQHLEAASPSLARKHLRQALTTDPACVRANWLLATIEREAGNYKAEIRFLRRIPEQDRHFTPIVLEPLRDAYLKLEDEEGLEQSLRLLNEPAPYTSAVIMIAQSLARRGDRAGATAFAVEQINANPSLRGIDYLMELYLLDREVPQYEHIALLQQHIAKRLEAQPRFRCHRCGFSGMQLHWHCPRCRSWGTVKPINGLEGE